MSEYSEKAYNIEQLEKDFPGLCQNVNKRDYVIIDDIYDWEKDYKYNASTNEKILRDDAKPRGYRVNGNKFSTIEEMLMHIELTYGRNADIIVNSDKDTDKIIQMWYEHQLR